MEPAGADPAADENPDSGTEDLGITEIEAPEALFAVDIGDAEVDFFLEGTWRASVFGSFGVLIGPDGQAISSPFPGLDSGRFFRQMPDLTFSVWLLNRFFIEASVIGDFLEQGYDYFDQNYILMGYIGAEGEFLKRVLIGSKNIGIDPFPFVDVPESGRSSLGVEALLGTGMSEHQLLLRYDNNEPASLTFIGRNLVAEQVIALDEYLRGRFFKLPDANVGSLEVYLEDPDGDFTTQDWADKKNYRAATVDDAVIDSLNGTVFLKEPAQGSVLVYYRKGAAEIGDATLGGGALAGEDQDLVDDDKIDLAQPAQQFRWDVVVNYLGQDLTDRQVEYTPSGTPSGKYYLRLYKPGEFSPFEILAGYALEGLVPEDLSGLRVSIVRKGNWNAAPSTAVAFRLTPGADFLQAYYKPDPGLRTNFRNLYPFLDATKPSPPFDQDNLLYGPLADVKPGYLDYEILVSELTPVSQYQIGGDVVPGSVQILRNGLAENRFEVDYASGAITFLTEIAPDDRLVVSFRRQSALANNGDILFAWGNTITFSEALNLQLATGVRWNFLPGSYTEEAYSRTGSVVLSAGVDGTFGPLSYEASLGGAYTNPDTTGVMRLLGMETTGIEVFLSENTAYPASPPEDDDPIDPLPLLTHAARGKLFYKDYRSYGLFDTSTLMSYTWDPPAEQKFPYDQMYSKIGPYVAAGSSEGTSSGESLVLDFDIAASEWIGVQIPASYAGTVVDLSGSQGVTVSFRAIDVSPGSDFNVYLQLGDIGEDLDEDGVLDEESSPSAAGFLFDDDSGVDLKVGSGPKNQGNNRLDSEDIDGNGFLDDDPTSNPNILTLTVVSNITTDTNWTTFSYTFQEDKKRKLSRVRSLRLIVDGTNASTARVLVDEISLAGSRFFAGWYRPLPLPPHVERTDDVTVRELDERTAASPPSERLEDAYSFVDEVFHPFGEKQKVLEIDWNNTSASTETWEVQGYTEAQSEGIRYRDIVYYYRFPVASFVSSTSELHFYLHEPSELQDPSQNGVHWWFPADANKSDDWREIRVSLDEQRIYRNGVPVAGSGVEDNSASASLTRLVIRLTDVDPADNGTLYLDELHLSDPEGALGAAATLDLELNLPGELLSWGGHPIIHDLTLRQSAAYASRGFSSLYGTPLSARSFSSVSELDFGLTLADMKIDFTVAGSESEMTWGAGHGITIPNVSFPLIFSDSFSLRNRDTGPELRRENTLTVNAPPLLQANLQSRAGSLEDTLSQGWDADLGLLPGPFNLQNSLAISGTKSGFSLPVEGETDSPPPYFPNWIQGYTLLAPWPGGEAVERKANLTLDWSLDTVPLGVQTLWQHGFHSYDLTAAEPTLQSTAVMEVELPFLWRDGSVTLFSVIPGYRRDLKIVDLEAGLDDYASDFSSSFQNIYSQQYLYALYPYAELFTQQAEQRFLDLSTDLQESAYSAEAYLRLSRRFSSRIRDLFLPSFLEFGLTKHFMRDRDLIDLYNSYALTAQSTALNLFGAFGAYPLFPFYRTDEFSTSLSLRVDVDGQTVQTPGQKPLRTLAANLDHFFSFEGERDNQLTFENRFGLQIDREESGSSTGWDDAVKLLYTWNRYPETGVRVPLLPEAVGAKGYWSHLESLELELNGDEGQTSYHPFNVILSHESSLILPDYGEIKAEISGGFDIEKTEAGERYWRFGFLGGISVQIEF
ncbi:MAG: hypothetical protein JSV89_18935 [Spirochaetaceae bacterium]|nr:MAG: hypothetical protein JSV89_18935 [Spirochaetaceae bacterium]